MLEVDLTTEVLEAPNEASDGLGRVPAVEVVRAKVAVFNLIAKHVVDRGEHGGRDCENGLLGSSSGLEAKELGAQVAVLLAHSSPCGSDQSGLQPGAALAH